MRISLHIFEIILKVPETANNLKKLCWDYERAQKLHKKLARTQKKFVLKIMLNIRKKTFRCGMNHLNNFFKVLPQSRLAREAL